MLIKNRKNATHYTVPMAEIPWSTRPQPVKIAQSLKPSAFDASAELTGEQKNYLITAQPTRHQRPINSFFFFLIFLLDQESICGATDTPILDFW